MIIWSHEQHLYSIYDNMSTKILMFENSLMQLDSRITLNIPYYSLNQYLQMSSYVILEGKCYGRRDERAS